MILICYQQILALPAQCLLATLTRFLREEANFIQSTINHIFDSRGYPENFAKVKMSRDFAEPSIKKTFCELNVTEERDQCDDIYDLLIV